MSLDLSKLKNVRQSRGKTVARCPACAEDEHDSKGEHLVIMADGRFGCIVHAGDAGKAHRRRILELAGDEASRLQGAVRIVVRRPAHVTSRGKAAVVVDLGCLGRVEATPAPGAGSDCVGEEAELKEDAPVSDTCGRDGRVFQSLALRENKNTSDEEDDIENIHTHETCEDPSVPSADPADSGSGSKDPAETPAIPPCPPTPNTTVNPAPVNSKTRQSPGRLQDVISFWPSSDRRGEPSITSRTGLDQQVKEAADQAGEMQRVLELEDGHGVVICPLSGDFFDPDAKHARRQEEAWNTIRLAKRLKWVLVTNFPRSIPCQVPGDWGANGFDNVCIGVTLPSAAETAANRIARLCKVPCRWRAVFVDAAGVPLDLDVNLEAIDWVVVTGGGNDGLDPRAGEWIDRLESKCRESGTAFFRQGHYQDCDQDGDPAPRFHPFDAHIDLD